MQSHYFFFNHYSWSFMCSHKSSKEMEKYRLNGPTHILFMSIYLLQSFLNTCGIKFRLFLSPCTALMEGKLPAVRAVCKMVSGLSKMVGIPTGHMNLKCLAVYPESISVEASPVYIKTNILTNHTSIDTRQSWVSCLIPQWQSYLPPHQDCVWVVYWDV